MEQRASRRRRIGMLAREKTRRVIHMPGSALRFDRDAHPVEFGRILNLSDGVFAIALTLLVLSLEIPSGLASGQLGYELLQITPMLSAFIVSVGIIGLFWFSHHELFAEVQRIDGRLMWLNIAYLSIVVLIPFVQRVQGEYPMEPIAYVIFASVLALLNLLDMILHRYVYRNEILTVQWSKARYATEIRRGMVLTSGFLVSIPLAFLLVNFTVVIWVAMVPLDQFVKRRGLKEEIG
jgi:uncharacterized membrane protein